VQSDALNRGKIATVTERVGRLPAAKMELIFSGIGVVLARRD